MGSTGVSVFVVGAEVVMMLRNSDVGKVIIQKYSSSPFPSKLFALHTRICVFPSDNVFVVLFRLVVTRGF